MDEIAVAPDDVVFLEQLDKHDGLVARHRFDHLPVSLGSAYDSDHIIDAEPSKDRRSVAASVSRAADGSIMVTASNGAPDFWAPGGMTRSWRVDPDQNFLLGGQRFRVRTRSYVASPRQAVATRPVLGRWAVLWSLPLALISGALITWLADIDGQQLTSYFSAALVTVAMLAAWSGAWALLSRLTGRDSHFLAHLSLAALAMAAVVVLDYVFDTAAFAFNLPTIQRYDYALVGLIVGLLVWGHARRVARLQTRTALVSALAVGGALFAFQALTAYSTRGNLASTAILTELRPPALQLVSPVSSEAFFAGSESLKSKVESSRSEKPDGSDLGGGSED
jgi:hypothetical protein